MRRALALLGGLLLGLLALWPARLALPAPPLSAKAVEGSIWRARLAGAGVGGATIGDVALRLAPAALAQGRLAWTLAGDMHGRLWRSLAGAGADGLTGRLQGAPLAALGMAGADLEQLGLAFDGRGRCLSAAGQVRVALARPLAGQRDLAGAPRCEANGLLLPLASGDGRVRLDLEFRADGWQARLAVAGAGVDEGAALLASGFRRAGTSLVQEREGRW
jgi:hypothetical protein